MSSKKKNKESDVGCLGTIFGYTILACIIYLIYDLIHSHISEAAKRNIKIVAIIFVVLIVIYFIFSIYRELNRKYTIKQLDDMEGHQFEYACADILKSNGFKNVTVTQGSGDFGVDIIAEKGGIKYAVQCKCYSHKLDNTPIQEVVGGLAYYNCSKGAVMTNQYFTEPAKELAKVNNVELWDRDVLSSMINKTKSNKKSDNYNVHKQTDSSFTLTQDYAERTTMLNNLEEYPHMLETFLSENAEYIVCYYKITFDVDLKLEKIDVLYKQNSTMFEFMYTPQLTTSKLKKSLKDLSEYINIENITFHSSCSIPGCFAIQVPMPDYMAKTSKFIDKNSK